MRKVLSPKKRPVSALATFRRFKAWATVLLAVYSLLVVLAAACPLDLAFDAHDHAHEHHHSSAHTILCTWSCQLSWSPFLVSLSDRPFPGDVSITISVVLTHDLVAETDILPEMRGPPLPRYV
jgi:hypothetical protein